MCGGFQDQHKAGWRPGLGDLDRSLPTQSSLWLYDGSLLARDRSCGTWARGQQCQAGQAGPRRGILRAVDMGSQEGAGAVPGCQEGVCLPGVTSPPPALCLRWSGQALTGSAAGPSSARRSMASRPRACTCWSATTTPRKPGRARGTLQLPALPTAPFAPRAEQALTVLRNSSKAVPRRSLLSWVGHTGRKGSLVTLGPDCHR